MGAKCTDSKNAHYKCNPKREEKRQLQAFSLFTFSHTYGMVQCSKMKKKK